MSSISRTLTAALVLSTLVACGGDHAQSAGANNPSATPPSTTNASTAQLTVPSPSVLPQIPVPPDDGRWSLLEKQQWAALAHDFSRGFLDDLNNTCNARVEGAFDFESFRGHFTQSRDTPIGADGPVRSHAMAPFLAVKRICSEGGEMEKNAVRTKVHRIEIHWITTGNSSFTFVNGVVSASINPSDGIGETAYNNFINLELKKRL